MTSHAHALFDGTTTVAERLDRVRDYVDGLSEADAEDLPYAWWFWARDAQQPPPGDWLTWVCRAGRGYGKTRTGAEETRRRAHQGLARRISLIGATAGDVRDVMIEGESGLLAVHPRHWQPDYQPSKRRIVWPNGVVGTCFSAEEPDRLRGPQSEWVWGDEPASWTTGPEAWNNAMLGNRLGQHPASMLTMTPRPLEWLKNVEAKPTTVTTTGTTFENIDNLAPTFIDLVVERFQGTRLGRQELLAQYLEDVEGALWRMAVIDATRLARFDLGDPWTSLRTEINRQRLHLGLSIVPVPVERTPWRVVVGVDPPGETAECGIVVGAAPRHAKAGQHHAVVLDDASVAGPPEVWGRYVVAAAQRWGADEVVVEKNMGGDMVRSTIHNVDPTVRVRKVNATDSKYDRAEPISTLYERGWVHHVGYFSQLETQQTTWVAGKSKSPDRLDALVHMLTAALKPLPPAVATMSSAVGRRIG